MSTLPRRPRRLISGARILALVAILAFIAVFAPAVFITVKCYGDGFQAPMARPDAARNIPNYTRNERDAYLALPTWAIIDTAAEYARFVQQSPPSHFPYFSAAAGYWQQYNAACGVTQNAYAFEAGTHMALGAAGTTFTVGMIVKGLYENSLGWLTERFSSRDTPEDAFAMHLADEYATFVRTRPWYTFPFADRLMTLWSDTPLAGAHLARKLERRLALTTELAVSAVHASVVGLSTVVSAHAAADNDIHVWVDHVPARALADGQYTVVAAAGPEASIVQLPRGETFTPRLLELHAKGARFVSIGGNDDVVATTVMRTGDPPPPAPARLLTARPVLSNAQTSRVTLSIPVSSLNDVITGVLSRGGTIEHIFDF